MRRRMRRRMGRVVLVASGLGFPLTQVAVRWLGRPGALVVEGVAVGLLARDAALIASGTPSRLEPLPAALLYTETAMAALAAATCLPMVVDPAARARALEPRPSAPEVVRRVAVGAMFGFHTWRFSIYLRPDHGRRVETAAD
jgi:hypothetical protein